MAELEELEWHERVRSTLDFKIENPNFFLWIGVQADPGATLDAQALQQDVESWLGRLGADKVFEERDEPQHTWEAGGLLVRFTAIPKRPEARGTAAPIVGNPVPSAAYRSGLVCSGTGIPVIQPLTRPPGTSHSS